MNKCFDRLALGSDIPRSRAQYVVRALSRALVAVLGLNRSGFITTEIVQAIHPVAKIRTRHGVLLCRGGHGRLRWRAETFHTEEPETIAWLDTLEASDVLWDIGANVGLYSIYGAKFRGCQVVAIEPESQNYALLVDNIALNGVGDRCCPACIALTDQGGLRHLRVRYITKGGAYNLFEAAPGHGEDGEGQPLPSSVAALRDAAGVAVKQLVFGASLDELVFEHHLPLPTHLKIDVDGREPEIIDGAARILDAETLRSILIELNRNSPRDMAIVSILTRHGFRMVSERSTWLSRMDRTRADELPTTNVIFSRA
jgi:FkbM family methyltransferase